MSVCFLTTGPVEWASARYRAYWMAERMDDAVVIEAHKATDIPDVDNYVFQKVINLDLVEQLKEHGKRVWWDVCDPMHWFSPDTARRMVAQVDGIVASNEGLADDLADWAHREVVTIPDRLKLSHYDCRKAHDRNVKPIRFIWFGSAQNRQSLFSAYIVLERLMVNGYNIELTIMDDRPDLGLQYGPSCPVYRTKWRLDSEVQTLANHDIAILPPYPGEWGRVKSNNKHLSAWACGLPVADGLDFIETVLLMDWQRRKEQADYGLNMVQDEYDITQSVQEWQQLLND